MADQSRRRGEIGQLLEGGYWLQVGDERRSVSAEEVAATTIATPPKRRKAKVPRPERSRRISRIKGTVTSGSVRVIQGGESVVDARGRAKAERIEKPGHDPKPRRA